MNAVDLIAKAIADPDGSKGRAAGYAFVFSNGDLKQMSAIANLLISQGIDVGFINVYPAVLTQEDFNRGLQLIWERKVEGWWNYQSELLARNIATADEFNSAFNKL
ncbi:MAG TPA: hypothetical protein VFC07_00595 [Verrucomicrobiae bacterium]|nr:hypothetical protein [Verrucomicrobiae bacterium]